jgi:hypothetical protein
MFHSYTRLGDSLNYSAHVKSVQSHNWMAKKWLTAGFLCRQIVRDHMNLFFARLAGHDVSQEKQTRR